MSEILFLFGEMDARFRPLVSAVRFWADSCKLTKESPGPYVTNFMLTLLVVFYLQTCSPPILPSLNEMILAARPELDYRLVDEVECTYLRDPSPYKKRAKLNQQSLEELFVGFLEFIESYPFAVRSISVVWGESQRKAEEDTPLYIQNPLEPHLNVSKNVKPKEAIRLSTEARCSLFQLEDSGARSSLGSLLLGGTTKSEGDHSKAHQWNKQSRVLLDINAIFSTKECAEEPSTGCKSAPVISDKDRQCAPEADLTATGNSKVKTENPPRRKRKDL